MTSAVAIRSGRRQYELFPSVERKPELQDFLRGVQALNVELAFTYSHTTVASLVQQIQPGVEQVTFPSGERVPVVDTMAGLASGHVRFGQGPCFIRNEGKMVIWVDIVGEFEPTVKAWKNKITALLWHMLNSPPDYFDPPASGAATPGVGQVTQRNSAATSAASLELDEKHWAVEGESEEEAKAASRKPRYLSSVYTGISVGLAVFVSCSMYPTIMAEYLVDGEPMRLALIIVAPFLVRLPCQLGSIAIEAATCMAN